MGSILRSDYAKYLKIYTDLINFSIHFHYEKYFLKTHALKNRVFRPPYREKSDLNQESAAPSGELRYYDSNLTFTRF